MYGCSVCALFLRSVFLSMLRAVQLHVVVVGMSAQLRLSPIRRRRRTRWTVYLKRRMRSNESGTTRRRRTTDDEDYYRGSMRIGDCCLILHGTQDCGQQSGTNWRRMSRCRNSRASRATRVRHLKDKATTRIVSQRNKVNMLRMRQTNQRSAFQIRRLYFPKAGGIYKKGE